MKIIIFIIASLSQVVFAQAELELIRDLNPSASNREVLKIFYQESLQAAELGDFDRGDDAQSTQECRMVLHSTQDTLHSVVIRKLVKNLPGNGPLFPARSESKLFLVGNSYLRDGKLRDNTAKTYDYISIDENAYDLIVTMRKNAVHSDSPFKLFLRKNGELISFKILTYKNKQDNGPLFEKNINEDYGYCWRN